jgi:hypothetical protein
MSPGFVRSVAVLVWCAAFGLAGRLAWRYVGSLAPPSTAAVLPEQAYDATKPGDRPATFQAHAVLVDEKMRLGKSMTEGGRVGDRRWYALRSDGSTAFWLDYLPKEGRGTSQRFISLVSGLYIRTDERREMKSTEQRPITFHWNSVGDPKSRCVRSVSGQPLFPSDADVGDSSFLGQRAVVIRAGESTVWFALDLGCALLRRVQTSESGLSEIVATRILSGEPDPGLFEVPERYEEVLPSTLLRLPPRLVDAYDAPYLKNRPKLP